MDDLDLDPTRKFLFSASGNRGWDGSASESLVVYDVTHKAIK